MNELIYSIAIAASVVSVALIVVLLWTLSREARLRRHLNRLRSIPLDRGRLDEWRSR